MTLRNRERRSYRAMRSRQSSGARRSGKRAYPSRSRWLSALGQSMADSRIRSLDAGVPSLGSRTGASLHRIGARIGHGSPDFPPRVRAVYLDGDRQRLYESARSMLVPGRISTNGNRRPKVARSASTPSIRSPQGVFQTMSPSPILDDDSRSDPRQSRHPMRPGFGARRGIDDLGPGCRITHRFSCAGEGSRLAALLLPPVRALERGSR